MSVMYIMTALPAVLAKEAPQLDSLSDKAGFALQNTVLGLLMVFAVLSVLYAVVRIVSIIMNRGAYRANKSKAKTEPSAERRILKPSGDNDNGHYIEEEENSEEVAAAISAAVAMILEGEGKSPSGFRVVSFRRSNVR